MTLRKLAGLITALLMIGALVPLVAIPAFAEGAGSTADCETGIQASGGEDLQTFTAAEGQVVDGVCIKSGANMFLPEGHSGVLGNGTYQDGCYSVSGVGTQTVTVERVGDAGSTCQGLSHVDVLVKDKPATTTTTTKPTTTTTEPTTTTTEPTTTTTEPTTTTTEPTTTTTEPTTTTTEPTTTTTEPTTTSSTTTSSTTTTEPEVAEETTSTTSTTSTTEPEVQEETTSTTEDDTEDTLPFTGMGTDGMAMAALVALASGAGLILLTRRSAESEIDA